MPNDNPLIDAEKVKSEMKAMVKMTSHPAFVAAMKNLKETPLDQRLDVGRETLTVEALKAQGVDMPDQMRLTTRYFEPGTPNVIEVGPDGDVKNLVLEKPTVQDRPPNAPGYGGCACGGGMSFCGGAGGGT